MWVIRPRPMGTHRTKTWFTPGEVVRRIGEDTYRIKVGHGQFRERHESQLLTRSRGGPATGRCGGHAQVSRQAKHYAHKGINALMSCDKAFQDPCHSATRERKYLQQHIRICTHGVETGLG